MKATAVELDRYNFFGAMQWLLMVLTIALLLGIAGSNARAYNISIDGGDCTTRNGDAWDGQTCTLGSDLDEGIIINADGIILNGNGYTVTGPSFGDGILILGTEVTIKNLIVTNFETAITINSSSNTVTNNTFENNYLGLYIFGDKNTVYNNNFIRNNYYGFQGFVFGSDNIFSDECKGGNYWDDFAECTPDSDGLCTLVYEFSGGMDELPWAMADGWAGKDLCSGSTVAMDIKPGSCDNPVNVKSKGVLPVVILGTKDFSVESIDVESLKLAGVKPVRSEVFDVLTYGEEGGCTDLGGDGYPDLVLKFKTQNIVNALEGINDGDVVTLTLTGNYISDNEPIPFSAEDTILIKNKGKNDAKGLKKPIKKAKVKKHNKLKAEPKKK